MNVDDLILFEKFLGALSLGVVLVVFALAITVLVDKYRTKGNAPAVEPEPVFDFPTSPARTQMFSGHMAQHLPESEHENVAHETRALPHAE